jgi:hypothetical protein
MASLVTSIIGGILNAGAASDAAKAQIDGYNKAGATVTNATNTANTGITNATSAAGDQVRNAAGIAGGGVVDAAANGSNKVNDAARDAGYGVTDAAGNAANSITGAAANAGAGVTKAATDANAILDPYASGGAKAQTTLSDMVAPGGSLMKSFSANDMEQNDPGYQFRIDQGNQALQRSAAARGGAMGGGVMQALARYSQGQASSEYQNAFNRFTTDKQQRYGMLSGVADRGMNASALQGSNLTGAARYSGDMGFAGEQAAGALRTGAAQYAGNANLNAAQFGANMNTNAAQYSGNAGMHGADEAANFGVHGADEVGTNTINAGRFVAGTQMGIGDAQAGEHLGRASAWSGMLGGIGSAVDGALTAGFSGGGAFNWGNAGGAMIGKPAGKKASPASTSGGYSNLSDFNTWG